MPAINKNPIKKTTGKVMAKTANYPYAKSPASRKLSASTVTSMFAMLCYGLIILLSVRHGNLFLKELIVAGFIILMVTANKSIGAEN